ncbi:MAG: MoxR family ATPase [Lachnospiraceae bacterium]|nr:MoxR family ATPase [Lachnospiraceae bacterium]
MQKQIQQIMSQIEQVIKGKNDIIEKVLAAIIAQGHILLEDIPGVGKTTLALTISKTMSLDYHRVQFTPDVLPSDLLGFNMFNSETRQFEYREGSVFCNIFLADEINRTSPKTQSALLEVMEEGRVTVDGVTRALPKPFVVIATQNPFGSSGTQKLPESQLDRFMVRLSMGYPDHENAVNILKGNVGDVLSELTGFVTLEDVRNMQETAKNIFVHNSVYDYIVRLTENTRNENYFTFGLSPRASLSLLKMSRAVAYMEGSDYVLPEHVLHVFHEVAVHRLTLSAKAKAKGYTVDTALDEIAAATQLPKA